jgi:hypothetical protein
MPCVAERMPDLAAMLAHYPSAPEMPALSFFYWSKEELRGRPVVLVTHVIAIERRQGDRVETLVAGRQLYAAHYMNAALNLTGLISPANGHHYLFVLNRSHVDVLGGVFGGVVRALVERRLRADLGTVIDEIGRRIEGGDPS